MTPDWSERPVTVPYAVLSDPQTLNLYSYVRNSPVARFDADGHFVTSAGSATAPACSDGTDSCHQNAVTTTTTITVGTTTPFPGADVIVTISQTTTVTSTDADGNKIQQSTTLVTQARYSGDAANQGAFLGATQHTESWTTVNGKFSGDIQYSDTRKSTMTASDVQKAMGGSAGKVMNLVGLYSHQDLYWGAVKSAARHPWETTERGLSAAGLGACLFIPGCAEGVAGGAAAGFGIGGGLAGIMNGLTGK